MKFIEPSSESKRTLKIKSSSLMAGLIVLFVGAIALYSIVFFKRTTSSIFNPFILIVPLIIAFLDWILLTRNDKWMIYVDKFDLWPKKKNRMGTYLVLAVIIAIIANLAIAIHFFELMKSSNINRLN